MWESIMLTISFIVGWVREVWTGKPRQPWT